ncbi:MAG: GNAT family N-acetyltransferase [Trueperaceae bacterium]|nr:GNAT family N-acetyltransferase [Trueperaceae bacterium]
MSIRPCSERDVDHIVHVVNDGAEAYRHVIPAACWTEPYMPASELREEIADGVGFFAYVADGRVVGVMGIQEVQEVTLIRHAYVLRSQQRRGIGSALLGHLLEGTTRPVLIGTWADATWAHRFYEKHGFRRVSPEQKNRALARYWSVPPRQAAASVVLADATARRVLGLT